MKGERISKRGKNGSAKITVPEAIADLMENPKLIEEWSDEELIRGYRRDPKTKKFDEKNRPRFIPELVHQELVKRRLSFAEHVLADSLQSAIETLKDIVEDEYAANADRLRAAGMILDRTLGKPKETVELTAAEPEWLKNLKVTIVPTAVPTKKLKAIETKLAKGA